ncbi:MAG: hypothetical protein GY772_08930 [bacterium]|nr:hypothetical protein [bacterium]
MGSSTDARSDAKAKRCGSSSDDFAWLDGGNFLPTGDVGPALPPQRHCRGLPSPQQPEGHAATAAVEKAGGEASAARPPAAPRGLGSCVETRIGSAVLRGGVASCVETGMATFRTRSV